MTLARPVGLGRTATAALAVPPLVFVGLFFAWPVLSILATGLAPEGRLAVEAIADTLGRPYLLDTIVFTVALAAAITLASGFVTLATMRAPREPGGVVDATASKAGTGSRLADKKQADRVLR